MIYLGWPTTIIWTPLHFPHPGLILPSQFKETVRGAKLRRSQSSEHPAASVGQCLPTMAPKLSKNEKQDLIVAHLRGTGTCHTLKELEKMLPSVAPINSILVKEYVQELVEERKLRVEKIGNGNWYWSFGSDEKIEREQQQARVQMEVERARKSLAEAEGLLGAETTRRADEASHAGADLDRQRQSLQNRKSALESDLTALRTRVASGQSVKNMSAQQVQKELAGFREQALKWTDNLYILEQHLRGLAGGDRAVVSAVLQDCYGTEYEDGALRELE